jgi:ABC-type enterobactin transport system permease subunit
VAVALQHSHGALGCFLSTLGKSVKSHHGVVTRLFIIQLAYNPRWMTSKRLVIIWMGIGGMLDEVTMACFAGFIN